MARKRYSEGSIARALEHHQRTGLVRSFSPPEGDRKKWIVDIDGPDNLWTTEQVYAMLHTLVRAERVRAQEATA